MGLCLATLDKQCGVALSTLVEQHMLDLSGQTVWGCTGRACLARPIKLVLRMPCTRSIYAPARAFALHSNHTNARTHAQARMHIHGTDTTVYTHS